jgi:hypothetical protein
MLQEEQRLSIPVIGRERPAMVEHDGLGVFGPHVFEKDFSAVFRLHKFHGTALLFWQRNSEIKMAFGIYHEPRKTRSTPIALLQMSEPDR